MDCGYCDTTRNSNHSSFLTPTVVGGRCPLLSEIKPAVKVTHPYEKRRLPPISAHNISTVGGSEKSSITTNINSTMGFQTSYRWSTCVTPYCRKGGSESDFYRATACNATHGIAVAILSVCPSVRLSVCPSDACIVTKLNNALRIF